MRKILGDRPQGCSPQLRVESGSPCDYFDGASDKHILDWNFKTLKVRPAGQELRE